MERETYEKYAMIAVRLVSFAVKGEKPDKESLDGVDLTSLFEVASDHMLSAAVGAALESAGVIDSAFHEAYSRAIRNRTLRDMENVRVFDLFEKAGIWYMPLKGAVLKDFYPYGIREMGDIDVLIDPTRAEDARDLMVGAGYEVREFGKFHHDAYTKPPIHQYELHRMLLPGFEGDAVYDYYTDVKERLICEGGMRFRFTPEDLYVYLLGHEHKHYTQGGTGLRSLLDVYMLMKKYGESLDLDRVRAECAKMELTDFEEHNRRTALALFDGGEIDERDRAFLKYIISSGVYGTVDNLFAGRVEDGKLKYVLRRLFPPMKELRITYPFFYRHKILLPALFFYRIARMMTVKSRYVLGELKTLIRFKKRSD